MKTMYNKNITKNLNLLIGILILLSSSEIKSQDEFLLTEIDMQGYNMLYQFNFSWEVGENKSQSAIRQYWLEQGEPDTQAICITYCIFDTETEAISGTAYHAGSYSLSYTWGSFDGSIIGDLSWAGGFRAIIFIRGNVGIQVAGPTTSNKDQVETLMIVNKSLDKIEENLSAEILSLEERAKQKQIPENDYQKITNDVVNSELMNDFSAHTTWDSKWMIDTTTFTMGIRAEWKNENGILVGIDICKFDTAEQAKNAANIQNEQTYSPIFNMDSLSSLETIIDNWVNKRKYGLESNYFSAITTKSNLAVHIYQFDSTKINTDFTYSIIELLVEQIDFF